MGVRIGRFRQEYGEVLTAYHRTLAGEVEIAMQDVDQLMIYPNHRAISANCELLAIC